MCDEGLKKYSLAHLCDDDCQDCLADAMMGAAMASPGEAGEAVAAKLSDVFGGAIIRAIIDAIKGGAIDISAVLALVQPIIDSLSPKYAIYINLVIKILLKLFATSPAEPDAEPVAPAPDAPAPEAAPETA